LKQLTDFNETWYEHNSIAISVLFNILPYKYQFDGHVNYGGSDVSHLVWGSEILCGNRSSKNILSKFLGGETM
jgi:hypothetical protein